MGLDNIKTQLEKKVKGVHISVMSESKLCDTTTYIKTPSLDLNRILSGSLFKGLPAGQLTAIVGEEHSMKTSFMCLCMAEALKNGLTPVIIDTEGGVKKEFAERWGLDLSKVLYVYTPWISKIQTVLAALKESGDTKMIIGLDSIGGIEKYGSYESALDGDPKSDQGQLQRQIRVMLKLFLNICIEQETIGIVTAHLYSRPGIIPMPDQIGGGKAVRLFPSILIQLKKEKLFDGITKDKKTIGSIIKATTIKNRIYPPFQDAVVSIDYIKGIDPYAGILDLGVTAGLIEKAGSWYSYKGERLGQGSENANKVLPKFPRLLEDINKWLEHTKYSSINELVKQAEEAIDDIISEEIINDTQEEEIHYKLQNNTTVPIQTPVEPVVEEKSKRTIRERKK